MLGIAGISEVTRLTTGGSSTIYRARQDRFDRQVAIKVLNGPPSDALTERFERELKVAGRVSGHPGILEIFDSGTTDDGLPWLMMPFVDAESFQRELDLHGAADVQQAVGDIIRIAEAVEYCHRNGVVHCDLKPGNVLRGRIGQPILIDFGVAQVDDPANHPPVSSGTTPAYTAPERFRKAAPTAATDIYSLGAMLYALLNGRPAFLDGTNPSIAHVVNRVTNEDPERIPGVPPAVMEVILHAMAKNPNNRPRSASLFAHYLGVALKDPVPAPSAARTAGPAGVRSGRSVFDQPTRVPASATATAAAASRAPAGTLTQTRAMPSVAGGAPAERDFGRPSGPGPGDDNDRKRRGMRRIGLAAGALLGVIILSTVLWQTVLNVSETTTTAGEDTETSEAETEPATSTAAVSDSSTTTDASDEIAAGEVQTDQPDADVVESDASPLDGPADEALEALSDDATASDDAAAEEAAPNYEGLRFQTRVEDGWVPVFEDRDVGYGYRTRFAGQNTDFLYVDFTPPERQSGSETIEESANRIAAQIRSASEVQYQEIGTKQTWWFSYIGNDGSERIDVFFVDGGTGYAVVGGSHGDPLAAWETVYNFVLNLETT